MKLKLILTFLIIYLTSISQDTIHRYGNVWHILKTSAYKAADVEQKDVIFVQGSDDCGWTQRAMQNMSKEPLFSLLSSKYIFWYCGSKGKNNFCKPDIF